MSAILPALRSAIQPAIRSALASSGAAVWSPLTLFAASEVGVWYDPSDFSTMFQDSAGTTPVTAVGQPVGLILDKSKWLVLGGETAVNGAFDTNFTGWTNVNGNTGGSSVINGEFNIVSGGGGSGGFTQDIAVTIGVTYKITITARKISGAGASRVQVYDGASFTTLLKQIVGVSSPAGEITYVAYLNTSLTSTLRLYLYADTSTTTGINLVSVKSIAGNHAYQATAASRLTSATGGAVDFDGTDDSVAQSGGGGSTTGFMLVAAIKPEGGAGTVRNIWSDTGTNTGYVVRINASNQLEMAVGNGSAYTTVATTATLDVGTAYVVSAWDDGTNLNVQINSGTVASATRPTVSAGSSTATIGKSNTSAASYFNGLMYQVLQTKNDGGTDAERTEAKAYCATKGGVTL